MFKRLLVIFAVTLSVILALGCSNKMHAPLQPEVLNKSQCQPTNSPAIIIIPGFKGTALLDQQSNKVWISVQEALFGGNSLALAGERFGLQKVSHLRAGEVLRRVPIIPYLYNYDVYSALEEQLQADFPCARITTLAYDWRESNYLAIKKLSQLVDKLKKSGHQEINIVAHSMGGMIASYYLRYGEQAFSEARENWHGAKYVNKLVLVGVPFRGSMAIVNDLSKGLRVGLNTTMLSAEAYGTFSSSYQLLPNDFNKKTAIDYYNVADWEKYQLGLFATTEPLSSKQKGQRRDFVKKELAAAKLFSNLLNTAGTKDFLKVSSTSKILSTKILNIIGIERDTLNAAQVDCQQAVCKLDFSDKKLFIKDGDWLVTKESASLPSWLKSKFQNQTIFSKSRHGALITAEKDRRQISSFLSQD